MATAAELALILKTQDRMTQDLRRVAKELTKLQKAGTQTTKAFASLGKIGASISIGAMGAAALKTGTAFNAMKEQGLRAFTQMLGSADRATAMWNQLESAAEKSPFDIEELKNASQRLLAFGVAADEVLPMVKDISDAVAGIGGSSETLGRVATAMGQMITKGKVSAEEMLQLAEAGIPAWQMLADNLDSVLGAEGAAKFRAGQNAFAEKTVRKLLDSGMDVAEANRRAGEMVRDRSMQQLMGLAESGKLPVAKVIAALRKGMAQRFGGIGVKATEGTQGAFDKFTEQLEKTFAMLSEGPFKTFAGILLTVTKGLKDFGDVWKDLPQAVKDVVGWIATAATAIGSSGALAAAVGWLTGSTGLSTIGSAILRLAAPGTGVLALLAGAIEIAKLGWDRNFQPIIDAANRFFTTFPHVKIALEWANAQAKAVADWIMGLGGTINTAVKIAVQWANDAARTLADWASAAAKSVTQTVNVAVQWANDAARGLADWAGTAGVAVTKSISVAVAWAGETAAAIGEWVQGKGDAIGRNIQTFLYWAGDTATALGDWFEGKGEAIGRNVQTFLYWAGDVATTLGDWFLGRGEAIGRNVQAFLHWAGDVATTLGDWFLGRGEAIGRNVQAFVSWAGDLAGRLGDWFEGRGGALGRNVQAYVSWAGDLANKIGGWIDGSWASISRTVKIGFEFLSEAGRRFFNWLTGAGGGSSGGVSAVPGNRDQWWGASAAGGGITTRTGLAMVHPKEAIIPLDRLADEMGSMRVGRGSVTQVNVTIQGNVWHEVNLEDAVVRAIDQASRRGRIG